MEISLLSGALGAEVKGINLKDSSDDNWQQINNLMLEHKVLFFRDQDISSEEQINLAKKFGPLEKHVYVKGLKNYPEIINDPLRVSVFGTVRKIREQRMNMIKKQV